MSWATMLTISEIEMMIVLKVVFNGLIVLLSQSITKIILQELVLRHSMLYFPLNFLHVDFKYHLPETHTTSPKQLHQLL